LHSNLAAKASERLTNVSEDIMIPQCTSNGTAALPGKPTDVLIDQLRVVEQDLTRSIQKDLAYLTSLLPCIAKIGDYARQQGGVPQMKDLEANCWDRRMSREQFRTIARRFLVRLDQLRHPLPPHLHGLKPRCQPPRKMPMKAPTSLPVASQAVG
jgi:hypothetical protein